VFPKVPDQHKAARPLIPNGLGVLYTLFTTIYLFLVLFFSNVGNIFEFTIPQFFELIIAPLTLAGCVLFGGFMGLLDDWMDLKWRYKAFMPLIAAVPLIYFAQAMGARTSIALPFIGTIDFGPVYFYIIIPLIVMIVTNTVNQLGGLNGLETICPAIVIAGLMVVSPSFYILLLGPLIFWLILAYFNVRGKIFVGNSGSFAIGITIASFAIISDLKLNLLISMIPFIFNSAIILLSVFFTRKKAKVAFEDGKLCADNRRSLVTTITYNHPMSERKVVAVIALLVTLFTLLGVLLLLLT
jgi:UDP-N-acetylglucosamine--dolichyl-phosphate N-acetylglucosaminephosphotransferase